jgi:hypothetical protein
MAATAPPTIRRRPGVLVAGAVVATALTAATAAAAPPAPMAAPAGVPVSTAPLGLGPMGSNDPELGRDAPRGRQQTPPAATSTARAATPHSTPWTA